MIWLSHIENVLKISNGSLTELFPMFSIYSGINGKGGDGDIYNSKNISTFVNFVKEATLTRGVHFMMADGGFSVEGQENIQEILSKRIYLCQFTVALGIVREGNPFFIKMHLRLHQLF